MLIHNKYLKAIVRIVAGGVIGGVVGSILLTRHVSDFDLTAAVALLAMAVVILAWYLAEYIIKTVF
ncbi:MAG: hypothetical protein MJZ85_11140 [Bacteroidales bacterium]|nr:hypothetical protein [Bacteroidales bacterium]